MITREIYKTLLTIYSKEFNYIFRSSMQIVSFSYQLPIKEEILSIAGTEISVLTKVAIAIQNQIVECETYRLQANSHNKYVKWTNALISHYIILEKLVHYIDNQ